MFAGDVAHIGDSDDRSPCPAFNAACATDCRQHCRRAEILRPGQRHLVELIVGGRTTPPAVVAAARHHAGGGSAHWVVIPSARSDRTHATSTVQQFIKEGGPHSILHTEDRVIAGNDAFAAPLASVPAVWITGGRQWRLADIYGGSRTARALYDLLARGGLIAGSSAGTSIMGSYLIRGSPSGNAVLMSPGHERGFGFLRNVAIDQHILLHDRESDLAGSPVRSGDLVGTGRGRAETARFRSRCRQASPKLLNSSYWMGGRAV